MEYGYNPYMLNRATQQPINNLVRVTGIEGARAYQLPAKSTVALFDANNDIFYVKTTDDAGFPMLRAFEFKEIQMESSNVPIDSSQYVSINDFNQLKESVDKLITALGGSSNGE